MLLGRLEGLEIQQGHAAETFLAGRQQSRAKVARLLRIRIQWFRCDVVTPRERGAGIELLSRVVGATFCQKLVESLLQRRCQIPEAARLVCMIGICLLAEVSGISACKHLLRQ